MKRNSKEHIKVWEKHNGKKKPVGYHIHHVDGNPNNNDISNLICITHEEHYLIHKKQAEETGSYKDAAAARFLWREDFGDLPAPWNKGVKGAQEAWNKGIPMSEEAKASLSSKLKGRPANSGSFKKGEFRPTKRNTPGYKQSEEEKLKRSIANSGEGNPMYGVTPPSAIAIEVEGEEFTSIKAAMEHFGRSNTWVKRRMRRL